MTDQTAMMLTQEEWDDLEAIVAHYRMCTEWVAAPRQRRAQLRAPNGPQHIERLDRRRALAQRIIEANH